MGAEPVNKSGTIKLSWTATVVPTGELPITGYSIRYHIRGSGVSGYQYMNAMQSPAEVTGLLPGTEYRMYVASVNAIGRGGYCCGLSSLFVRTYIGKFSKLDYLCLHNMYNLVAAAIFQNVESVQLYPVTAKPISDVEGNIVY